MGILDSILGGLMGGGGTASPLQNILGSLLSGQGGAAQGSAAQSAGETGGLASLLNRFQQAGLGNVAQSWVSNGQNQSVSPQQLQNVFGQDQVQNMAQQANMQPHDLLSQLAQLLPGVVDKLTPGGHVASSGSSSPFDGPGIEMGGGGRSTQT